MRRHDNHLPCCHPGTDGESGEINLPPQAANQPYIKSFTVVPIVMRVPLSTPTMCVARLKEES
jgi:hypothetical protein